MREKMWSIGSLLTRAGFPRHRGCGFVHVVNLRGDRIGGHFFLLGRERKKIVELREVRVSGLAYLDSRTKKYRKKKVSLGVERWRFFCSVTPESAHRRAVPPVAVVAGETSSERAEIQRVEKYNDEERKPGAHGLRVARGFVLRTLGIFSTAWLLVVVVVDCSWRGWTPQKRHESRNRQQLVRVPTFCRERSLDARGSSSESRRRNASSTRIANKNATSGRASTRE